MNITELTKEIINGRRLTRDDDLSFFETEDLNELAAGANEIRQALCGNRRSVYHHQWPRRKMFGKLQILCAVILSPHFL